MPARASERAGSPNFTPTMHTPPRRTNFKNVVNYPRQTKTPSRRHRTRKKRTTEWRCCATVPADRKSKPCDYPVFAPQFVKDKPRKNRAIKSSARPSPSGGARSHPVGTQKTHRGPNKKKLDQPAKNPPQSHLLSKLPLSITPSQTVPRNTTNASDPSDKFHYCSTNTFFRRTSHWDDQRT